jgi:hypothetical protein
MSIARKLPIAPNSSRRIIRDRTFVGERDHRGRRGLLVMPHILAAGMGRGRLGKVRVGLVAGRSPFYQVSLASNGEGVVIV